MLYATFKPISVGEGSEADIKNVLIENCKTAIASKDGSSTQLLNAQLLKHQVGLAVYTHKQHFGPGKLTANHITFKEVEENLQIEKKYSLYLDGELIPANADKVWEEFQKIGKKVKQ